MAIKTVGEELQSIRLQKGITIEQLASGIYSERNLSRILSGNSRGTNEIIQKLLERLDLDTDLVYGSSFQCEENFQWFYLFVQVRFFISNGHLEEAIKMLTTGINTIKIINDHDYQEYLVLYSRILILLNDYTRAKAVIKHAFLVSSYASIDEKEENFSDLELELKMLYYDICSESKTKDEISEDYRHFLDLLENVKREDIQLTLKMELPLFIGKKYYFNELYTDSIAVLQENESIASEAVILVFYAFYEGLSLYKLSDESQAMELINQAIYSAAAANSVYFNIEINTLEKETGKIFEKIENSQLYKSYKCDTLSTDVLCKRVEYEKNSYSINNIIYSVRESKGITLNKLSNGLLTVKSLHSYEKGTQKISAFTVEALLERLGISADIFTIYGKAREVKLYNLRRLISQQRIMTKEDSSSFIHELEEVTDFNNSVESQFYKWACYKMHQVNFEKSEDEINYLKAALSITLPDFDIYHIQNYLLSQQEFKLILNIAQLYLFEEKKKMNEGIYYLEQLLRYIRHNTCDIINKAYTEGVLIITYIKNTYKNNANISFDYEERFLRKKSVCSNLKYLEVVYFYYMQTYNGILLFKNKLVDPSDDNSEVIISDELQGIISLMKRYYLYACMIGDLLKSGNPKRLKNASELTLFRQNI